MSIAHDNNIARLAFGQPDRLGKALDVSGTTSMEMAEYLGVTRTTISNYINGHTDPKKQTLRLWAMKTGVPLEWIETGELPTNPDNGGGNTVTAPYQRPIRNLTTVLELVA